MPAKKSSKLTSMYYNISIYLYIQCYKSTHPKHSSALYSQGVLIDLDDFGVLQDFFELRAYGGQSVGHEQRSGQHSPNGHLRFALIDCQTKVADQELQKKKRVI